MIVDGNLGGIARLAERIQGVPLVIFTEWAGRFSMWLFGDEGAAKYSAKPSIEPRLLLALLRGDTG
jgi:hypothetical protein